MCIVISGLRGRHVLLSERFGRGKPRHVRGPSFLDIPFAWLWQGDLAADRIEALTAKLAQGVARLEKTSTQLDWCIAAQKISKEIDTNLAEIKGE